MTDDKGRVGHTDNDPFNIFVCYVVSHMKKLPRHEWRKVFNSLANIIERFLRFN